ncbi:3-dehydroquinate synthase [Modestobacter sp. SYSU DS0875]
MTAQRITVAGDRPYDVVIGPGVQAELALLLAGTPRAVVVHSRALAAAAGAAVETLQEAGVAAEAVAVPDGEAAKTAEVAAGAWEEFGQLGLTRSDAVVGVGGGAVTDLAGFLAATWLRGVRVVQVPTSLLGMVDAAVGGKTGINTRAGKNLVGAFHPPAGVLADTDALAGLPEAEFRAGLAEVVKCGFIADGRVLELLEADPTGRADTVELIARAVQVKAEAVGEDLYDTGRREFLNYGHTLAHAIERVEDFGWRHGEAVAVGLVFAAELAGQAGLLSAADVARHRDLIAALGLPTTYRGDWQQLQAVMRVDKKARGASLRFVVLDGLGNPRILTDPDQAWLDAAWTAVSSAHPAAPSNGDPT